MVSNTDQAIERPSDLTPEWLTATVRAGAISQFTAERIGTGQMSECYRIGLTYSEPETKPRPSSVVLKVAATDPVSRQTGLALGLYEREVRFYHDIAPRLGGAVAPCYHAAINVSTGVFDLLLDDAGLATVGDEIAGATTEQAFLGVTGLGRLHGPLLGDMAFADMPWLNRESPLNQAMITPLYTAFIERYADHIAPAHLAVCERLVSAFDGYLAEEATRGGIQGLVHGDYRLDNLLFGAPGATRALTVVDWQTVSWGPAFTDLAYFVGCALPAAERREQYEGLLQAYHEALGPQAPVSVSDVRDGVRHQSFFGVMMAIVSSMLVERTDRGDRLFMTMLERHCQHVLDIDALAILPDAAAPEPLRPVPEDEGAHPPTDEPLWSESWYADFVDAAEGLGGWFRIGLIPNQQMAWIHALVCGPDEPTVVVDYQIPMPPDAWTAQADGLQLAHHSESPLRTYRVDIKAKGQSYQDPSALLRGAAGEPVDLAMNLVWTTGGIPYQYRLTTRYEIPCAVSGTVTVKHARYQINSVPGQRDHSWGVRDWWSMDWMWTALHLQGGTHLHGVRIQIPNTPAFSIGYAQDGAGKIIDLTTVDIREAFGANGLPENQTLELIPAEITADVRIRAHAPVRLVGADGRVSHFPRAWVDVTTTDGRTGTGWMEWNRSQVEPR
ncbi:DUF7064 domain-containing protein [Mycobacterium camsae]|uniref:DUF7064 domain-containing protein n=1 Tax=Mycobacterium gordonae TaxID=1778 RepID=UPI00197F6338|nr:phosphotransferase [Mycobacterium gordonae]